MKADKTTDVDPTCPFSCHDRPLPQCPRRSLSLFECQLGYCIILRRSSSCDGVGHRGSQAARYALSRDDVQLWMERLARAGSWPQRDWRVRFSRDRQSAWKIGESIIGPRAIFATLTAPHPSIGTFTTTFETTLNCMKRDMARSSA